MRALRLLLLLLLGSVYSANALAVTEGMKTYCNHRFLYCLDYLAPVLSPMPEAQNGDGRLFMDKQGRERLRVYGTGNWNFNEEGTAITLQQLYAMELKGGRYPKKDQPRQVTFKAIRDKSFIISGIEAGEIYYLMVVQGGDAFCYAYVHYPQEQAQAYKPTVELLSRTFRYIGN